MGESREGERGRALLAGGVRAYAAAALLFGAVVLGYLWPVLIGGDVFSPIAGLYAYVPWERHTPSDILDYYNWHLSDIPLANHPWRVLVRDLLHEGTFPAWNPYALSGIPLYSNVQNGLFSVFNLPLWLLPMMYGAGVSAAVKLVVGALGMFALARQLRLGFLPGLLAGVAFAFAAVNILWLAHETLPGVLVMLPWAVLLVERIFERGRIGSAIALALVIAIALGGGHPGMQVHLLVVVAVYAVARAGFTGGAAPSRWPRLALAAGGLAAGTLLMAFMLIPEARSAEDTVGLAAREAGTLSGQGLPLDTIQTVLFPDRWGRPSGFELRAFGAAAFQEWCYYAGTVALLLACVGLLSRAAWRRTAPFALIGVLGLAVTVRVPGLHWLATELPVLEHVEPQRLHFAFAFAVAILSAFGLQALLSAPRDWHRRIAVPLVALLIALLAFATLDTAPGDVDRTVRHFTSGIDFELAGVLALTSIAWFALFSLGVGAAIALAGLRPRWATGIAVAVVLLAVADAYRFASGFQPMGPQEQIVPPRLPAIDYLREHRDDGRIVGVNHVLPNDWNLVHGLRDVRGYDPPQPTRRMLSLWRIANPDQVAWHPLSIPGLSLQALPVLDVLGARYIVLEPGFTLTSSVGGTISVAHADDDVTVLENAGVPPRAFVPARMTVADDAAAARARIAEAAFDARTTVAVERDQPGAAALSETDEPVRGTAEIVAERNAGVTLRVRLDRPGLVVLNDQLLDGWSVTVDGERAPALHVNTVMRGVAVPAGDHEVEWSYAVPGLRLGLLVSAATAAALVALAVALGSRRRRALRR